VQGKVEHSGNLSKRSGGQRPPVEPAEEQWQRVPPDARAVVAGSALAVHTVGHNLVEAAWCDRDAVGDFAAEDGEQAFARSCVMGPMGRIGLRSLEFLQALFNPVGLGLQPVFLVERKEVAVALLHVERAVPLELPETDGAEVERAAVALRK